ncbi:MAG: RadC family protein [Burkholderiales bacterium]|jgi:DNA repair protein RadC
MKHLPDSIRPREKLLARGAQALADAELLALLLRTGCRGMPVLQLAQHLLDTCGGLPGLLEVPLEAMRRIKGLGPAKRAEVAAVMELARRSLRTGLERNTVLASVAQVKQFVHMNLRALPHEVFAVLFTDAQNRLIAWEEMFRGTIAQTSVYPREVVKRSLALNASAVILVHNHPSGVPEPSRADVNLTQQLQHALNVVDVRVLDHLVVGCTEVVSMAERGLM